MSVLEWIKKQFKKNAVHYVYAPIPASRVEEDIEEVELNAEEHYFRRHCQLSGPPASLSLNRRPLSPSLRRTSPVARRGRNALVAVDG